MAIPMAIAHLSRSSGPKANSMDVLRCAADRPNQPAAAAGETIYPEKPACGHRPVQRLVRRGTYLSSSLLAMRYAHCKNPIPSSAAPQMHTALPIVESEE